LDKGVTRVGLSIAVVLHLQLLWHPLHFAVLGLLRVEYLTRNQEVVSSSLSRAHGAETPRQVSHTYVPRLPSNISWFWPKGGDSCQLGR